MPHLAKIGDSFEVKTMIELCFYCGKPKGSVLCGSLTKQRAEELFGSDVVEKIRASVGDGVCYNMDPCANCLQWLRMGCIILISYDPERSPSDEEPYRTGGWGVFDERQVRELISDREALNDVLANRVAFIEDAAWRALGLPLCEYEGTIPVSLSSSEEQQQ